MNINRNISIEIGSQFASNKITYSAGHEIGLNF